jgi:hypothetical protein
MPISKRILGTSLLLVATALASATMAEAKHYSWQKDPGPIAGRWSLTCQDMEGMVVEFRVDDKKATGSISQVGKAAAMGYSFGEEIFRLEADDFGDWVGQLLWKGADGRKRWDPIRFVATSTQLDASTGMDSCYKKMPRAR